MTCKVAQNTLLSSQTTTTHEAGQPDPAGRRPSKQQEKNIHHPPQKHKPPTNPHPKNPTNKPPPTACRTHPQTHHKTPQTHHKTPKQPASNNKSLTTRRVATAEPDTSHKHTPETGPRLRHRRKIHGAPKTEAKDTEEDSLTSIIGDQAENRRRRKPRITRNLGP